MLDWPLLRAIARLLQLLQSLPRLMHGIGQPLIGPRVEWRRNKKAPRPYMSAEQ